MRTTKVIQKIFGFASFLNSLGTFSFVENLTNFAGLPILAQLLIRLL
jgi:hypothetical protein